MAVPSITTPNESGLKEAIRGEALRLGFELAGFSPAAPPAADTGHFRAWLERGYAGEMAYLARRAEERADPRKLLPGARSAVVVGLNYHHEAPAASFEITGQVSSYAWGEDYHRILGLKLEALAAFTLQKAPGERCRAYVDTGPVLERALAQRGGLGWIGKNTLLISPRLGSWLFLGVLFTTLDLEPDLPGSDHCGTCTLCLEACPTQAFAGPWELDARRCISYLTIEHRGEIPAPLAAATGDHVAGCDICQDVCPWNRRAPSSADSAFAPQAPRAAPQLASLIATTPASHRERFGSSSLTRIKPEMMVRNAMIAAANAGPQLSSEQRRELAAGVEARRDDENPLVRAAAAAALTQLAG